MTLQFPAFIMPSVILYFLFFCSGLSGLVYQVVWMRQFGNVFGNTIYSASIVVSIFMLGLGLGSYVAGVWADRHYERTSNALLRAYGAVELIIAFLGLAISLLLPRLAALVATMFSYAADRSGWFELSPMSYVARGAIAAALLLPITTLMGGTLTLLIRHRVREDVESAGAMKIAVLYTVNTAGAALGAFLTDFCLVPAAGLRATQLAAVVLNVIAGAGAYTLARRIPNRAAARKATVAETKPRHISVPTSTCTATPPLPECLGQMTSLATLLFTYATLADIGIALPHWSLATPSQMRTSDIESRSWKVER